MKRPTKCTARRFLGFEKLEGRAMLVVFAVNSTADAVDATPLGDGRVDVAPATPGDQITLRAAIQEANARLGHDTIQLPAGTYALSIAGLHEDNAARGDLDVRGDLTITGAGPATTIINAAGIDRALHVLAGITLEISGVTITGGNNDERPPTSFPTDLFMGGGIYNAGSLTVTNCIVSNNHARWYGGGISNSAFNSSLTVINCTFSGNSTVEHGGGAIMSWAVFESSSNTSLTITDSVFTRNTARRNGGAILAHDAMTIAGSTFAENSAGAGFGGIGSGGAISTAGTGTLINSTVSANSAYSAGGIHNGGALTVTHSTITANTTRQACGGEPSPGGCPSGPGGGILNATGATLNIKHTIVAGNVTPGPSLNGPDVHGSANSQGYNLIGNPSQSTGWSATDLLNVNPMLGPLQNNGGWTSTHALQAGSPAVDAGDPAASAGAGGVPQYDQRGTSFNRVADGDGASGDRIDIGAFELQRNRPPAITTNAGSRVARGGTDPITSSELNTTDADNSPAQLVYTITTAPANGTLRLRSTPANSFTQADITAGLVTYLHNGSDATSDSFVFSVSDGTSTLAGNMFAITITSVADSPTVTVANGRLIIEGTANADIVTITGIGRGTGVYDVTTASGTQRVTLSAPDILINLHGGDDELTINNAYVLGMLDIKTEGGADEVTLGHNNVVSTTTELRVDLGAGNDILDGLRLYIGTNQLINGGDGDDWLIFEGFASPQFTLGTSAAGNANWNGGAGDDIAYVIYAFVVGAFAVDLGVGNDWLDIFGSAASGNVSFFGGVGEDILTVDTNFFDADLLLDGGADGDEIWLGNGLGTELGTVDGGSGADTVVVDNQTTATFSVVTGAGRDIVDVRASAFTLFFAGLGDDDDELSVFGNLSRFETTFDGGLGGLDRLLDLGNSFAGFTSNGFESFS